MFSEAIFSQANVSPGKCFQGNVFLNCVDLKQMFSKALFIKQMFSKALFIKQMFSQEMFFQANVFLTCVDLQQMSWNSKVVLAEVQGCFLCHWRSIEPEETNLKKKKTVLDFTLTYSSLLPVSSSWPYRNGDQQVREVKGARCG